MFQKQNEKIEQVLRNSKYKHLGSMVDRVRPLRIIFDQLKNVLHHAK